MIKSQVRCFFEVTVYVVNETSSVSLCLWLLE